MKRKIAHIISRFFIFFYQFRYGSRIQFGKGVWVNHKLRLKGQGKLIINDGVNLWAHEEANRFYFYGSKGIITLGKNGRYNGITCHCQSSIELGEGALVGSSILMDTDFHAFKNPEHVLYGNVLTKPIYIGPQVWLGGQSVILKGVSLGEGVVVGFRAVVSRSFSSHVVVAGNPAKGMKERRKEGRVSHGSINPL